MEFASIKQNFQDWITQQWVILSGKKICSKEYEWLLGPFGNTNGIGEKFINQLAENEYLEFSESEVSKGLIKSIDQLDLSSTELNKLSKNVIDFYENTSCYEFNLKTKWNPFFKIFGYLLKIFFSNRIEQLNIPMNNNKDIKGMNSNIIQLIDRKTKKLKRTIWLRTFKESKQVVYSGVYETCAIPNGNICIKAMFPLPNGNATVILQPSVGDNGELILKSAGSKIGDSGFYFLLKDKNGNLWTKYVKSFKDNLTVSFDKGEIKANQKLTFYGLKVLSFEYEIKKTTYNTVYN
ncbi:hypothetical protein [Tenacibaculum finnmarkense]|uniref:hypothetical protein n=1 Tax=Tenacibaculum finnmarkense TaxID=2781243 RepID=UPI00187B4519|nr:hypothetical protein [Tenacibaculum finnmarkense]MBE7646770.1 hypothetical protein [Tenacibaculum finnmarkense genomovar ulcerans]MCD8411127.1 hypothetical protein [Tenacibaculum finnmarkense genomovar ulcerans]MCD8433531.1 hypothetical protein [Tenacibaculum finnmarkense genomovar ulcerans]